jgi:hypothetical protein
MGAVLVIEVPIHITFTWIPYRVVAIEPVPPPDIVDVAVSVIINTVSGDFIWVNPDVRSKVRMVDITTCVNDGHECLFRSCVYAPGFRGIDVSVINRISCHPGILKLAVLVVQAPHLVEFRVVRDDWGITVHLVFIADVIPLSVENTRRHAES